MEPLHVKEALSLLGRVHLFAIQNEGDGGLQHPIEGIINIVEDITVRSKKQTSILIVFIVKCFLQHVYAALEFKSQKCSYSKYSLFPHPFCQKMSTYLDRAKKKVKILKIEKFDQISKKWTPPNSGQFWPDP